MRHTISAVGLQSFYPELRSKHTNRKFSKNKCKLNRDINVCGHCQCIGRETNTQHAQTQICKHRNTKTETKKTQTDVFIKAKALLEKRQMCGQWHCIGEVNREEKTVHTVRYLTRERKHCELHTVSLTL